MGRKRSKRAKVERRHYDDDFKDAAVHPSCRHRTDRVTSSAPIKTLQPDAPYFLTAPKGSGTR